MSSTGTFDPGGILSGGRNPFAAVAPITGFNGFDLKVRSTG
jgi:hypothetical protein